MKSNTQIFELLRKDNREELRKGDWHHDPIVPYSVHQHPHCARLTIASPKFAMAKTSLSSQNLHGFGNFRSSSSDRSYIRSRSNSNQLFVKNALHISKKSRSQKLPYRVKNLKVSPSPSPKRARRGSDASDRPLKQQKRSSEASMARLIRPF